MGISVVVVGEALFDCLADQKGVPREQVKKWIPHPGGAPANVAAALGKLGTGVGFISAFGNDSLAADMKKLLKERSVDLTQSKDVDYPTRDVLVVWDDCGDRSFVGFGSASADCFADCYISTEQFQPEYILNSAFLVTGTLGLAYPETEKAMIKATNIAKSSKCKVLIDVNWRPVFFADEVSAKDKITKYIQVADVIKLSDEEAEWLFKIDRSVVLDNVVKVLENLPHAQGVLLTAGEHGCAYAFKSINGSTSVYSGKIPCLKVAVEDTTGAGDAFLAGFLHYANQIGGLESLLNCEAALLKAVQYASASGGLTTTKLGGIEAQPSEKDILDLLTQIK